MVGREETGMDELDFSKSAKANPPAKASIYDPAMATEFFSSAGKPEPVAKGVTLFAENEQASRLLLQRDKMYLLLEGEVSLSAGGKVIGTGRKGEIFGELAWISQTGRSASAVANLPCRVIALDDGQFQGACGKNPSSRSC